MTCHLTIFIGNESLVIWVGGWVERWRGHFVGPRLVPRVLGIHSARYSTLHYFQYSTGTESLGGWVDGDDFFVFTNAYTSVVCSKRGREAGRKTVCVGGGLVVWRAQVALAPISNWTHLCCKCVPNVFLKARAPISNFAQSSLA